MERTYPSRRGPQRPSVELIVRQGPGTGRQIAITGPAVTVGRHSSCDIQVDDPGVSRQHARITWRETGYAIEDLGSANGTFVNGERLTVPRLLRDGDAIGLGQAVLLGFQASPAVSPVEPPARAPRPPARGLRRFLVPAVASLGVLFVLAVAAALGYYFLWPREAARPAVLIRSPQHGEQVEVGQEVTIRSVARSEARVTRVELWVDDQLQEAQTSPLDGGSSPFPLLVRWRPTSPGSHTLTVRAFNSQGGRSHNSVRVEAVERADRDGDGIPDVEDACPDETGLPEGNGCPASGEGDRDGDGVADDADACPAEPGWPGNNGCPTPGDRDGDGVPDAEDASPEEWGLPEHAGSPDGDGDGIPDTEDADPDNPGPGSTAGAPDGDGDGIPDVEDTCPWDSGPVGNGGCPDTGAGDRDGDRVPDDVDLAPGEPGLPGHGGSPPPGQGEDSDGDGTPDAEEPPATLLAGFLHLAPFQMLPEGSPDEPVPLMLRLIQFEPLAIEVSGDYDVVDCYAHVGPLEMERFSPIELHDRRAEITEAHVGEGGLPPFHQEDTTPLSVYMECYGYVFPSPPEEGEPIPISPPQDLGDFTQNLGYVYWDGREVTTESEGGEEGAWFRATYRICRGWCGETELSPPTNLRLVETGIHGRDHMLDWDWEGEGGAPARDGYRVYLNGDYISYGIVPERYVEEWRPACGERNEFYVTAYIGYDHLDPDVESAPSNTVTWTGERCPFNVRVTFDELRTGDHLPGDERGASGVGPIYGHFEVNGERIEFGACDISTDPREGYRLEPGRTYSIDGDIFDWIRREPCGAPPPGYLGCPWYVDPDSNSITVQVNPATDNLTISAEIMDCDADNPDDVLFDWARGWLNVLAVSGDYTFCNRDLDMVGGELATCRNMELTFQVEEVSD
jgi:hypothetical protein